MPILVELPRICLSSLVNVCFPKCVDSHMHVRFARPSFASDIDNLSVTAVPFVTGRDWNHLESDESHEGPLFASRSIGSSNSWRQSCPRRARQRPSRLS